MKETRHKENHEKYVGSQDLGRPSEGEEGGGGGGRREKERKGGQEENEGREQRRERGREGTRDSEKKGGRGQFETGCKIYEQPINFFAAYPQIASSFDWTNSIACCTLGSPPLQVMCGVCVCTGKEVGSGEGKEREEGCYRGRCSCTCLIGPETPVPLSQPLLELLAAVQM